MDINETINKDDSDNDTLEIVVENETRKRKTHTPTESEKLIIESIEDELEKRLEEKATRTNLNATNVKNIIRHVITNEYVLNLIRNAENSTSNSEDLSRIFEPKLTRSKAKELGSNIEVPSVSWKNNKPKSEVHALLSEELQEDSSEEEYIPGAHDEEGEKEDESEDDRDSSIFSDSASIEPPTPPPATTCNDSCTQTNWTEDGVFKIPSLPKDKDEDEATIALRTRSKLSLSSTPLEVIEEAFIPPDITTDMYEMDCDNEDWANFLKTFTRPLEEIVKAPEEEELDPEYNVLADEEVDKPDKEELRMDKGVKVSRKELNDLMTELYEFCTNEQAYLDTIEEEEDNSFSINEFTNNTFNNSNINENNNTLIKSDVDKKEVVIETIFTELQICLLEQQMRQHVQMLVQNFLLTYEHPELHSLSFHFKEYLYNLKYLADGKNKSYFLTINLIEAINLIENWENILKTNSDDVKYMKIHIEKVIYESIRSKQTGNQYIVTFPTLIMETISKSNVFLYPNLLPKIPFKSPTLFSTKCSKFTDSEVQLIAMGLEQFFPIAKEKFDKNVTKKKLLKAVVEYIHEYMLPIRTPQEITRKITQSDYNRCADNPIKHYFKHQKAPVCIQYVISLEQMKILPPNQRKPEELPYQWRNYIYFTNKNTSTTIFIVNSTLNQTNFIKNTSNIQKPLFSKGPIAASTPICPKRRISRVKTQTRRIRSTNRTKEDPITKFVKCLSKVPLLNLFYTENDLIQSNEKMLPHMPSLLTPVKINLQDKEVINNEYVCVKENESLEISEEGVSNTPVTSFLGLVNKNQDCNIKKETTKPDSTTKDNQDDINALLIASSTVKPTNAEKKRAKLKKDFLANLSIVAPEDREIEKQKNEMFAYAYYDKMRETLDIESYHKIMQILNEYEEGDAVELYKRIEAVLRPKYKDLADEFLLFLREREAAAVGRLVPWIRMNNRSKFLRKLEIYFKDQPSQLKKIYQGLTELSQAVSVSMDKIKSTLLPMFKGNAVLTDLFLQNFMDEPPPASLLEGPYEVIDVNKEMANDESIETIVVPDVVDKYGGITCICGCHEIEDAEFKSRLRHCTRCGTKFMNGKVYMASGRGLRPARLSFPNSTSDNHQRLIDRSSLQFLQKKKRTEPGSLKSAAKENQDEDSDEDGIKKKKLKRKPPQKRPTKKSDEIKAPRKQLKSIKKESKPSTPRKRSNSVKKSSTETEIVSEFNTLKPGSSEGQQKRLQEESCEESAAGESSGEVKPGSPEQNTAESESEFCEESSQDNCESDSNLSSPCTPKSYAEVLEQNSLWKREEDKIILEVFQKENDKDHAFRAIANQLTNRSVDEIKARFDTLMDLLMKTVENYED